MKNASKLLFAQINDYKKDIIAFFYLFDLFKRPLIIPLSRNSFQHGNDKSFKTIININLKFVLIIVFSDIFLGATM